MKIRSQAGYTLVEMAVVMGIIALVSAIGFAAFNIVKDARFDSQAEDLLASLRDMQTKSRSVESNREYGIAFTNSSWTTQYRPATGGSATSIKTTALSDATVSAAITPSATEIYFSRLSGKPVNGAAAVLTLTQGSSGKTKVIRVNSTGVLYAE